MFAAILPAPKWLHTGVRSLLYAAFLLMPSALALPQGVVGTVSAGAHPSGLAVNPATNLTYLLDDQDGTVTVVDGATHHTTVVPVGNQPSSIAVNPATNRIYVANYGSATVTVIDGRTNGTTTVPVGAHPFRLIVNPVTNEVFLLNDGSAGVTILNGATNAVTTLSIPLSGRFSGIAVNPVTNKVYVAKDGDATFDATGFGAVVVVDGSTQVVEHTIYSGSRHSRLGVMALNPVTNRLYLADQGYGNLAVIDCSANAVIATLPALPEYSFLSMAVDPVANKIYAGQYHSLTVIDGATHASTTLSLGTEIHGLVLNPATHAIFVPNGPEGTVTVIDGTTHGVTTLAAGKDLGAVALNPVTNRVFVADPGAGALVVIDGATYGTTLVAAGAYPSEAVVNPVSDQAFVLNDDGTVTVIDGATLTTTTVPVGSSPSAIALNPVTNKAYVLNWGSQDLTILDGAATQTLTLPSVASPSGVAVNPVSNKVYVTDSGGTALTVIDGGTLVVTRIEVGGPMSLVAVNAATNRIYLGSAISGSVSVLDGATQALTTLPLQSRLGQSAAPPTAILVHPGTNRIYVTNGAGSTLTVIDGATQATQTLWLDKYNGALAMNSMTNRLYVSMVYGGFVGVIDGRTNTLLAQVPVGSAPHALSVDPVRNRVYAIVNGNPATITEIDGATHTARTVPVGEYPVCVAVDPGTDRLFVPNRGSGTVSVIEPDGHLPVPLAIAASGQVDGQSVPNGNLFTTRNLTPSFTATATSTFTASPPYLGLTGLMDPPPTSLCGWVDDGTMASWNPALPQSAPGANPATFSLELPLQYYGLHTLYLLPAYANQEGDGLNMTARAGTLRALPFAILPRSATGVTLLPDIAGPYTAGQSVTFTANGQGSSGYQYRFYLFHGPARTLVQDFSETATWHLPASLTPGRYRLEVWVRTAYSTEARDARADAPFQIKLPPATGVTLTPSMPSPFPAGQPVLFSAVGQGSSDYQYAFRLKLGRNWELVQPFSDRATYALPRSLPPGSYTLEVWVRAGAKGPAQARQDDPFTIIRRPGR